MLVVCWQGPAVASEAVHWSYGGDTGPEHWADLSDEFEACRLGKNQSPIDIKTQSIVAADLSPIELDYQGQTESIVNNGHTLQVNVSGHNVFSVEGEQFKLSQFHFHSPSEHRIDGEAFPLEAHFVHQNEKGELAVIGLMFRLGENNPDLIKFGEVAPKKAGDVAQYSRPMSDFVDRKSKEIASYYRYNGSLTTPPCSEGLRWFVIPLTETMSEEQVASYIDLIGADARGAQPVNARVVLHRQSAN